MSSAPAEPGPEGRPEDRREDRPEADPRPLTRLLAADHPELAFDGDPARARAILEAYRAKDADQEDARACMLAFLDEHPRDAHLRECVPGHLTASALILSADRRRALFTHHRKLDRWLQLGGHCDGDANLPAAALREAVEESGIAELQIDPTPIDLDIHLIPERPGEEAHLHLDTRFLILAPEGASFAVSDESHDLAWLDLDELEELVRDEAAGGPGTDLSVLRLARIGFAL